MQEVGTGSGNSPLLSCSFTTNHPATIAYLQTNNLLPEISCHSSDISEASCHQHNCNLADADLSSDVTYSQDNANLPCGFNYQLSDASFPEWPCHFTSQNRPVQPRRFSDKHKLSAERTGPQVCMLALIG